MAFKIRPLHDRVIVKRLPAEEKNKGGSSSLIPPRKSPMKGRSSPSARDDGKGSEEKGKKKERGQTSISRLS